MPKPGTVHSRFIDLGWFNSIATAGSLRPSSQPLLESVDEGFLTFGETVREVPLIFRVNSFAKIFSDESGGFVGDE